MVSAQITEIFSQAWMTAVPLLSLSPSQWAENYAVLSSESSAEPGKLNLNRTPYLREFLDCATDPTVRETVFIKCSQIGFSTALNCLAGYFIHIYPSPQLLVQPTEQVAKAYSRERIAPLFRDTPVLSQLVRATKSRDRGNTILHKEYPGGHFSLTGANSAAGLRSRPIRIVLLDEIDAYPDDCQGEGDPVTLAQKRAITFLDRVIIKGSTPTVEGFSKIQREYEKGDQRAYLIPCPACDTFQELRFPNLKWNETPAEAYYVCPTCGYCIDHTEKSEMLARGKWQADKPFNGIASFRINGLYSPWLTWGEIATEFLESRDDPAKLKAFINTVLGETWKADQFEVSSDEAGSHREEYEFDVPDGVLFLTAGADFQHDRAEIEVVGWGLDDETWSVDYRVIYGDPAKPAFWQDVKEYLTTQFEGRDGKIFTIKAACLDSGYHSKEVCQFAKENRGRRWYAIKGSNTPNRPIFDRKRARAKFFWIGTEEAKEWFHNKLKITEQGPGYCHFPSHYEDEYFRQLLAEVQVQKRNHKGYTVKQYEKVRRRNEALDCRVYAIAAQAILNPNFHAIHKRHAQKTTQTNDPEPDTGNSEPKPPPPKPVQKPKGFVSAFARRRDRRFKITEGS